MQTLEIKVPESKAELLKELGVTIKVKKEGDIPNAYTIQAMDELKAGKGIGLRVSRTCLIVSDLKSLNVRNSNLH